MIGKNDHFVVLSIAAGLLSVGLYYVVHLEYFKIFAVLFALINLIDIGVSSRLRSEKARDAGIVLVCASVVYVTTALLWR